MAVATIPQVKEGDTMQSRNENNYKGIDIASYQAGLDFSLVKQAGISIVYIKATEGLNYTNPCYKQHYQEAKDQGLKVGFYHYFWPNRDAVQQMSRFIASLSGLNYDCLPALDVEELGGLSKAGLSGAVAAALKSIASLSGHKPAIYCNTNYARNYLDAGQVGGYPVWIADYNNTGHPGTNPIWSIWAGYQYSSKGNVGGKYPVDLDEFTDAIFINPPAAEDDVISRAKAAGLIAGDHNPSDPAAKEFVLITELNLLNKINGGK